MRENRLGLGLRRRPSNCFEEESCFAMGKGKNCCVTGIGSMAQYDHYLARRSHV